MVTRRKDEELADRLLDFAVEIIRLIARLDKSPVGQHVSNQVLKSGTSPGAHYEEARGAESMRDFIHKLRIGLKELKETRFWLRLINRVPLAEPEAVIPLMQECEELIAIKAKSIITARKAKSVQAQP
jgi:four helix bundle protein